MARPREFDTDAALDGAIAVFREHGFEGTSAQMLSMRWGSDDRASTPPSATSGSSIARRRVAMGWANVLRISTRFEAARVLSTGLPQYCVASLRQLINHVSASVR